METEVEGEGKKKKGRGEPSGLIEDLVGVGGLPQAGQKAPWNTPPHSHVHTWDTSSCTGFKGC